MISAASSGSGKTTVTTALLKAFSDKKYNTAAYKAGPDYIDPMFHRKVIKVPSRNLDKFMLGDGNCRYIIGKNSKDADISIIEGVMGYYDGIGSGTLSSSYELAGLIGCPVVLVLDCKGMAVSVCAVIEGFRNFRENSNIRGVILNNVSERMYGYYKNIIEENTDVKVYGHMPHLEECMLKSRHLGLITAAEIEDLEQKVTILGKTAAETIDIEGLYKLASGADYLEYNEPVIKHIGKTKIAVAQDEAFCFYYQDSLDLLEQMGAELISFSPLRDKKLPDSCGLYIGGGYPELYIGKLSENKSLLKDIKEKASTGMPVYAECGGYMYLLEGFRDGERVYELAGVAQGESFMTKRLNNFGYVRLTAKTDNLMCRKGESICGHEFHYSNSTNQGDSFIAEKPGSGSSRGCIIADETRFMGYPHINLLGNTGFAESFIKGCIYYGEKSCCL